MGKEDKEKGEDPSVMADDDDDKNDEEVNGKGEDANMDSDLHESQIKKLGGSSSIKTTIIGDSFIQILSEIERWQPNPRNRKHVKAYPELTLDSVIEKVDEILSEDADTENLVLSVFQNHISIGLSASNVENEFIPCAYSTVEDLLEKASNIGKYLKKTYPKVKVFWVSPGPVGYYSEKEKEEEKRKEEKEKRKAEEKKAAEERKKLMEKKKAEEKKEKEREKKKQEKEKKKQEKEKKKLEKEKKKLEKEKKKQEMEDDEEAEDDEEEEVEEDDEEDDDEEEVEEDMEKEETNDVEVGKEEEEEEEEIEEKPGQTKIRRAC